jgi:hypothetical protein
MKKYESLYKEMINFHLETKVWKSYSGLVSTQNEVELFENKIGCKFGKSMSKYLQMLGNGDRYNVGFTMFNYQNILFATENLKKKKIYSDNQIIELNSNQKLNKQFKEICCINYIDYNGYFTIVNSEEENPHLFGGEAYDLNFEWHNMNFTTHLRNEIFLTIMTICNNQRLIRNNNEEQITNTNGKEIALSVKLDKYNWTKYYQEQHRNTYNRLNFNEQMQIKEIENKSILGFEEYELEYIKYHESSSM